MKITEVVKLRYTKQLFSAVADIDIKRHNIDFTDIAPVAEIFLYLLSCLWINETKNILFESFIFIYVWLISEYNAMMFILFTIV